MMKYLVLCILIAYAIASGWEGSWYVVESTSPDPPVCQVPATSAIANITVLSPNNLLLTSTVEGLDKQTEWSLDWGNQDTRVYYCYFDGYWCVKGILYDKNGANYANLTWSYSDNATMVCTTVLTESSNLRVQEKEVAEKEFLASF